MNTFRLLSPLFVVSALALAGATAPSAFAEEAQDAAAKAADTAKPAEAVKPADTPAADEAPKPAAPKPLDVKSTFRNICGFCHADYGRKPGKGPQLMNTERSDEFIMNRIKHGLPSRMAAFGSIYSDDQIRDIVKFIRNLKDGVEPQNP